MKRLLVTVLLLACVGCHEKPLVGKLGSKNHYPAFRYPVTTYVHCGKSLIPITTIKSKPERWEFCIGDQCRDVSQPLWEECSVGDEINIPGT